MANNKPTPKNFANKSVQKPVAETVEEELELELEAEVELGADEAQAEAEAVEEIVAVEETPEPVVEVAPAVVASNVPPTTYAVVGGGTIDSVHLSKCVFKSTTHKRSLTVHHLQRRLMEWGYMDAYLDKDGYFGDLTLKSVNEFRNAHGIVSDVAMDAETLTRIFEGDTNVSVVID
jgi:hypothetical protein